jgi:hypothetical protein
MLADLAGDMDEQSSQYLTSLNELNNAKQLVKLDSHPGLRLKLTRRRLELTLLTTLWIFNSLDISKESQHRER